MKSKKKNKNLRWVALSLFVAIGTYNAVVINTHSVLTLSDLPQSNEDFRQDFQPGRIVAQESSWKKLSQEDLQKTTSQVSLANMEMPAAAPAAEAAIQDELHLELIEVSNPKRWKQGLTPSEFEGALSTSNGVIDSFSLSLPTGENIGVEFVEMNGNVFRYDLDGQVYNAMIFQADQFTYMVSFTDGPLEGTRLRFSKPASEEQFAIQQELSENYNVEVGTFGVTKPHVEPQAQESAPEEILQAQTVNMDPQVL